jgi:hypothetical protein
LPDFEEFRQEVLRDPSLQQRLFGLGSKEDFVRTVVGAGSELGFEFTAVEVEEALRAAHAEWVLRWV